MNVRLLHRLLLILFVNIGICQLLHTQDKAGSDISIFDRRDELNLEEIASASDLIVIGKFESQQLQKSIDDVQGVSEFDERLKGLIKGVKSKFSVEAVLKGKYQEKKIVVGHFNHKENVLAFGELDFPIFLGRVQIPIHAIDMSGDHEGKIVATKLVKTIQPKYVIFLKTTSAGEFVPASGQTASDKSFIMLWGGE